jgi:hypothetical protein
VVEAGEDGNWLRNELKVDDGEEPIVWKDFKTLYMTAPMIGIVA